MNGGGATHSAQPFESKDPFIGAANGKVMIIKQLLTSFAKHNRIDYALLRTEWRTHKALRLIFIQTDAHTHSHRQIEEKNRITFTTTCTKSKS